MNTLRKRKRNISRDEIDYRRFIEDNFEITNKEGKTVPFRLNSIQLQYLEYDCTWKDIILKFRKPGFSSLINAIFTADFILKENSKSLLICDLDENAEEMLFRVKDFIKSYEVKNKIRVPLKYDAVNMLYNPFMKSRFSIATAKNADVGRSRDITNLHCSEVAFYPNIKRILAGAGQAMVSGAKRIFETTANGFNEFRKFYQEAKEGQNGYKPIFYGVGDFYSKAFLEEKKRELKELALQEYPNNETESFLASGECYFDKKTLSEVYLFQKDKYPIEKGLIYV